MQLNIMNAQQHGDSPSDPPTLQAKTFEVGDLVILDRKDEPPVMILLMGKAPAPPINLTFIWGLSSWEQRLPSGEIFATSQWDLSVAYEQGRLTFVSHPETLAEAKQIIDAFNQITS